MKKISIIYKKSTLEHITQKNGSQFLKSLPNLSFLQREDATHNACLEQVQELLAKENFKTDFIERKGNNKLSLSKDLVISLGGDGTFIYASHFLKDTPLFGINSAPKSSVGFYCSYIYNKKSEQLKRRILNIVSNSEKTIKLNRLSAQVENQQIRPLAINDFLITDNNPSVTSRYEITHGKNKEKQKSSGIWISSYTGQSAAYRSSGGTAFSNKRRNGKRNFAFKVRELYQENSNKIAKGVISEEEKFSIVSQMLDGRIFIDGGAYSTTFLNGQKLTINFGQPLFTFHREGGRLVF